MREGKTKSPLTWGLGWSGVITLASCGFFDDWPPLPGDSGILDAGAADHGDVGPGDDWGAEETSDASESSSGNPDDPSTTSLPAESTATTDAASESTATTVSTSESSTTTGDSATTDTSIGQDTEAGSSGGVVEPTVHKFEFVRRGTPDEPTVELHWSVTGVSGVIVPTVDNVVRPPTGSLVIAQYPQDIWYQDYLTHSHVLLDAEDGSLLIWDDLVRLCFFDWILPQHLLESEGLVAPENCPTRGIVSPGVGQDFEHGFMLGVEENGVVYWGTYDNLSVANGVDANNQGILWNYYHDYTMDASFPGAPPPAGLLQPSGRLGEVWRLQSNREANPVGALLGWAIEPPVPYEVRIQSGFGMWITRADGGWLYFDRTMPYWNAIVLGDGTIIAP